MIPRTAKAAEKADLLGQTTGLSAGAMVAILNR